MGTSPLRIITGELTGTAPLDTAVSRAILRRVSMGELPETLQVGMPHRVVAFGRHDVLTDGFDDAVGIAVVNGFDPTIRIAGGRAVVFHPRTVRFAWTVPTADPTAGMHERFSTVADHVVAALASFGIAAAVGELEREYCPGRYSVHINGARKVMGSGQRLARRAAQVAGMIVVGDAETVNDVLEPIYGALGLDVDPSRTGAVADVLDVDAHAVASVFTRQFTNGRPCRQDRVDSTTMALARTFQPDHDPRELA